MPKAYIIPRFPMILGNPLGVTTFVLTGKYRMNECGIYPLWIGDWSAQAAGNG